jgi:hypothetical protein
VSTIPAQVEESIERRLREAGLSKFVNREQSQFLDMQNEVFVEVVLNDGTALADVEKIIRETAQELKTQGIKLDSVVRALWEIDDVSFVGPSRSADGGVRAASLYDVTLKSGNRQQHVGVDVFWGALEFLKQKRGLGKLTSRNKRGFQNEVVAKAVWSFVQHQLSLGGTSYWSPVLRPQLEMNDAAMLFVFGQSTAFNELWQAVSDTFDPPVVDSFLEGLALSRKKIQNFDGVLPELSNMLGGAYRRAATFSTSANELFQKLDRSEQELLKKYFYARVELLKTESPELIRKFSKVFS